MGDGRIPWTAVQAYCVANNYDDDLCEDMHYFVRAMDVAYLEWRDAQNKKGKQ